MKLCCNTTRNIGVWKVCDAHATRDKYKLKGSAPAVLHTCGEARAEALKRYSLWESVPNFAKKSPSDNDTSIEKTNIEQPIVFINRKVDRVVIVNRIDCKKMACPKRLHPASYSLPKHLMENNVQFLAIDFDWFVNQTWDGIYPWAFRVQQLILFDVYHVCGGSFYDLSSLPLSFPRDCFEETPSISPSKKGKYLLAKIYYGFQKYMSQEDMPTIKLQISPKISLVQDLKTYVDKRRKVSRNRKEKAIKVSDKEDIRNEE